MAGNKLRIKSDHVNIFEMETDPEFEDIVSEEEGKKITAFNDKYTEERILPALFQRAEICDCQMMKIMERHQNRVKLLGPNYAATHPTPEYTQADIDSISFAVIIDTNKGYYKRSRLIIRTCNFCGKIQMYGDFLALAYMIEKGFMDHDITMAKQDEEPVDKEFDDLPDPKDPNSPEFLVQDIETGKYKDGTRLAQQIFGTEDPKDSDVSMTDIEQK